MKRTFAFSTALLLALTACGGGEPAADSMESGTEASEPAAETQAPATGGETEAPAAGEMTMPDWYQYDEANNAVTLDIISGNVPANNYWNYQGYANGEVTVVVPVGAEVTLNFTNEDPNMAHSIGVAPFTSNPPASVAPDPVFEGAITSNATSMTEGTLTGESETITFTASEAGEYSLACYIPGHAVSGMWIGFNVSADGEAGLMGN